MEKNIAPRFLGLRAAAAWSPLNWFHFSALLCDQMLMGFDSSAPSSLSILLEGCQCPYGVRKVPVLEFWKFTLIFWTNSCWLHTFRWRIAYIQEFSVLAVFAYGNPRIEKMVKWLSWLEGANLIIWIAHTAVFCIHVYDKIWQSNCIKIFFSPYC
jgi:hypothetical protein